jgi:2-aminoethylphosphonate-pyruvate transaminase
MLRDWGSWDDDFNTMTAEICAYLRGVINDKHDAYVCVPMQGSGTFAVEAALGTLLDKKRSKTLVLSNGAYGQRICKILSYLGRSFEVLDKGDSLPILAEEVEARVRADATISDVVVVHCETSAGILNPLHDISSVVARHGRRLIIDAMSSFAALPLDVHAAPFAACIASANKCLEGVPGFGFVLVKQSLLAECKGNAHSLSLDLYDQWQGFVQTGKCRYTPPTHVVAACREAIRQHVEEGGAPARLRRYEENHRVLVAGMREMGLRTLMQEPWLSPIITTFLSPEDPGFSFARFYQRMKAKGYIIYPGKLTAVESFRLGTIGHLDAEVMRGVVRAVGDAMMEMGVNISRCH